MTDDNERPPAEWQDADRAEDAGLAILVRLAVVCLLVIAGALALAFMGE